MQLQAEALMRRDDKALDLVIGCQVEHDVGAPRALLHLLPGAAGVAQAVAGVVDRPYS